MKMWSKRSNLDEMQEQEMLKIERGGCWLAFWGLLDAMAVETILFGTADYKTIAGEWIVFMVLALYMAAACVRKGIWDRRLKMSTQSNLVISLIAGLAVGAFNALVLFKNYRMPVGTLAGALIAAVITFALCFIVLTIAMGQTRKRQEEMEKEPADADRL